MRLAILGAVLGGLFFGGCSKGGEGPGDRPAPAPSGGGGVAPAPAALAFAGTCTVTAAVSYGLPDAVVCTEYTGSASTIEQRCTGADSPRTRTRYSPEPCPAAGLAGKCIHARSGHVDHHYGELGGMGGKMACENSGGSWSAL
jgi:hypothetical protein